jgi:hypothetical protein
MCACVHACVSVSVCVCASECVCVRVRLRGCKEGGGVRSKCATRAAASYQAANSPTTRPAGCSDARMRSTALSDRRVCLTNAMRCSSCRVQSMHGSAPQHTCSSTASHLQQCEVFKHGGEGKQQQPALVPHCPPMQRQHSCRSRRLRCSQTQHDAASAFCCRNPP